MLQIYIQRYKKGYLTYSSYSETFKKFLWIEYCEFRFPVPENIYLRRSSTLASNWCKCQFPIWMPEPWTWNAEFFFFSLPLIILVWWVNHIHNPFYYCVKFRHRISTQNEAVHYMINVTGLSTPSEYEHIHQAIIAISTNHRVIVQNMFLENK
jgi:hypothetical protein